MLGKAGDRVLCCALALLFAAFNANARPGAEPALRLGAPDVAPWSFHTPDCQLTGIAVENVKRLAQRAGLPFEAVQISLSDDRAALAAAGVDLFLHDPALHQVLAGDVRLPIGHSVEIVAISPLVRDGKPPASSPRLRVAARTKQVAITFGFADASIQQGEVTERLADDWVRGGIDVLIGARESLYFALLARGIGTEQLRRQTAVLGRRDMHYFLTAEAEARWGERLREAARVLDWSRSDRQLRQRFLQAPTAQAALERASCEHSKPGIPSLRPQA